MSPVRVLLQPIEGGFERCPVAGHGESGAAHAVDVVGMAVEAPGEFLHGEELGVVVFQHGGEWG